MTRFSRAAPTTESQAYEALRRAQIHADKALAAGWAMATSAEARARDAAACFNRGDFWGCANAAIDSLSYTGKAEELRLATMGLCGGGVR